MGEFNTLCEPTCPVSPSRGLACDCETSRRFISSSRRRCVVMCAVCSEERLMMNSAMYHGAGCSCSDARDTPPANSCPAHNLLFRLPAASSGQTRLGSWIYENILELRFTTDTLHSTLDILDSRHILSDSLAGNSKMSKCLLFIRTLGKFIQHFN